MASVFAEMLLKAFWELITCLVLVSPQGDVSKVEVLADQVVIYILEHTSLDR